MLGLAFVHMWIYCSTHRPSLSDDVSTMAVMYLVLSAALAVLAAAELRAPRARLRGPSRGSWARPTSSAPRA